MLRGMYTPLGMLRMTRNEGRNPLMETNQLPAIDVADAAAEPSTTVLLDVREADEWDAGHAERAINIPLGDLVARADELPAGARVVCICRSGNRSGRATSWLRAQGVDAVNMTGGMTAWAAVGQPLIDGRGRPGMVI